MSAVRKKWLLGDQDSNLTLKAMDLYNNAMEYKSTDFDDIISHSNAHIIN